MENKFIFTGMLVPICPGCGRQEFLQAGIMNSQSHSFTFNLGGECGRRRNHAPQPLSVWFEKLDQSRKRLKNKLLKLKGEKAAIKYYKKYKILKKFRTLNIKKIKFGKNEK
jgi:hypothetical protein